MSSRSISEPRSIASRSALDQIQISSRSSLDYTWIIPNSVLHHTAQYCSCRRSLLRVGPTGFETLDAYSAVERAIKSTVRMRLTALGLQYSAAQISTALLGERPYICYRHSAVGTKTRHDAPPTHWLGADALWLGAQHDPLHLRRVAVVMGTGCPARRRSQAWSHALHALARNCLGSGPRNNKYRSAPYTTVQNSTFPQQSLLNSVAQYSTVQYSIVRIRCLEATVLKFGPARNHDLL